MTAGSYIVVGPSPPPVHGGAVMTQMLVEALDRQGKLAAHLDTRDPRPLGSIGRFDLQNVGLALRHAAELGRLARANPDAAVLVPISQGRWGFLRDAVLLLVARALGRRRVVQLHGGNFPSFREASGPVVRVAIRVAIAGVAEAWVLTEGLRAMFGDLVPPERVRVLENAVAPPLTEIPDRDGGRDAGDPLRLLYVSNLTAEKGPLDLLDAIDLAWEDPALPPVRVRIVGADVEPAFRLRVAARARELERDRVSVELAGPRTGAGLAREYRDADLLVHPSWHDGQPLVLLEAMATGLPIVTTAAGGNGDTVVDGETGLVVEPRDVGGLAAAIRRLASEPVLRARLGAAGRERYLDRYAPECFARRVAALTR